MSGQGKHKNLQLVQWLRNPWVRCDNVARGPIPEWQAALMFEAANVIEQLETTRTPDPAQIRADAIREAAARVSKMRILYQIECGRYDPTTGITEFPGTGDEWISDMEDIEQAILALIDTPRR